MKPFKKTSTEATSPSAPAVGSVRDERKKVSEQIARLQNRQREILEQTTAELEELKNHLENDEDLEIRIAKEKEPLLNEIAHLRKELVLSEEERAKDHRLLSNLSGKLMEHVHLLNDQVRNFSLDLTHNLEHLADSLGSHLPKEEDSLPYAIPTPETLLETKVEVTPELVQESRLLEKLEEEKKAIPKAPKKAGLRRLAIRFVSLALLVSMSYGGWKFFGPHPTVLPASMQSGLVAGASTDGTVTQDASEAASLTADHPEERAAVSFDNTLWETLNDPDFGITMSYPSNAGRWVGQVGGNNKWFMRSDKSNEWYILKITRDVNQLSQADWFAAMQSEFADQYTFTNVTYKKKPALLGTPTAHTATSSIQYFVPNGDKKYMIWELEKSPNSDDEKRLKKMDDSLQFVSL